MANVLPYGYDGSEWFKLGYIWGYNDVVSENIQDTNLAAGTNYLNGTVVPSGEIHVVTLAACRYEGAVASRILIAAVVDGVTAYFFTQLTPTTLVWYSSTCQAILKPGDKMMCTIVGAAAGDTGRFRYAGYKMKLGM